MEKVPRQEHPHPDAASFRCQGSPGRAKDPLDTGATDGYPDPLPKPKDPGPVPATTTTIKRTSSAAWAWQVITRDGSDWRQGTRSSRADAENDARAARGALEGGGPDLAP